MEQARDGDALRIRGGRYPQTYCYILSMRDRRIVEHCDTALVERILDPLAESDR